jgi:RHS repeat-associated protein
VASVTGSTVSQHTDTLGSIVTRTNVIRGVVGTTVYEPYGSLGTADPYEQRPGFTGHMTDAATTLSYMQQRYYDPIAMRFASVDPVAASTTDGGNFNRYWYANNNPYKYTDPDGEFAIGFAIGFAIDVGVQLYSGKSLGEVDLGSAVAAGAVSAIIPGLGNLGKAGIQSTKTIASSTRAIAKIAEKSANTANRATKNAVATARNSDKISSATADVGKAAVTAAVHQAVKHEAQSVAPEVTVRDSIQSVAPGSDPNALHLTIRGANTDPVEIEQK